LAVDDVRKAFDNVVIADVVKDHHHYLKDPALPALTAVVLRGGGGAARRVGIDQDTPYSPVALNVRLHHLHDVALAEDPSSPPGSGSPTTSSTCARACAKATMSWTASAKT
jgi:hypothetical protein